MNDGLDLREKLIVLYLKEKEVNVNVRGFINKFASPSLDIWGVDGVWLTLGLFSLFGSLAGVIIIGFILNTFLPVIGFVLCLIIFGTLGILGVKKCIRFSNYYGKNMFQQKKMFIKYRSVNNVIKVRHSFLKSL